MSVARVSVVIKRVCHPFPLGAEQAICEDLPSCALTSTLPRGSDGFAKTAPCSVVAARMRCFRLTQPESTFAERGYPVAARRSWKIRRSIL